MISHHTTPPFLFFFLPRTCIPPLHGSYISPQGFSFSCRSAPRALAGLPFAERRFGERGGAGGAVRASLSPPSPLFTPLHKRRSVPCPQLTHLRRGPPLFLACLQRSAHACLAFHNRAELRASARRPHKAGELPAEKMSIQERQAIYKNPSLSCYGDAYSCENSRTCTYSPFDFTHVKCRELLVSLVAEKGFFFFFAQKRGKHAQKQGDVTAKHTNYSGDS